jgi:N-acetylglucosamine-6-phosphate deacetylase
VAADAQPSLTTILAGSIAGNPDAAAVVVSEGFISQVLSPADLPPAEATVVDYRPHLLAPGCIDVHTHGGAGCSFSSGPPEDTLKAAAYRATTGTTAILPTVTGVWDELVAALAKLAALTDARRQDGAAILGVHVEGPFVNPVRKGAISESTMRRPSVDDLRRLQDVAAGTIRMMTIAPELPGALPVVEEMVRLGIVPSIGHSDASYQQALDAVAAGARKSTHTYNAMRPLHHRDPGTVGAVLADDRLVAELIADGVHVHPGAMRVLLNAKGPANVALVTDAIRYAGLPEGVYERAGRGRMTVKDGAALLDDGTLAGSVSPLNRNLRLLRDPLGVSVDDLFTMAARVPAALLGWHAGTIAAGCPADLAVYDSDFTCLATFVAGHQVFRR